MYSNFFISLITVFFFILILVGLYTVTNFIIHFFKRYWRGFYRMSRYLYKRLHGEPESDAMHYAMHH
ncbi:hypothetical protein PAF15_07180 [Weissella koreensis]|uniref:Uncharacterized protein n=1 Tax=Weissella koreensis TaxID=165096 RepID=A0A7H1MMQ4_9LACO|nr:hypothetical protein [Weissella koreensis]AVH75538.1 hypothetical protein C4597_05775 [Weissella koreensis]MCZ9311720.1 hypothetical protein [Weissella koreensis]QGN20759.1 hypothetical protein GKC51_05755 [Weissella koreensis]QNT64740.1 hypothetical protein FY536_05485 [Weissella koreensis]